MADDCILDKYVSYILLIMMSACDTFFKLLVSSYHYHISRVITIDKSGVHAKGRGQRSQIKVTEVKTYLVVSGHWLHFESTDGYGIYKACRGKQDVL